MLQDEFGVSERRACAVVGQHRSVQRSKPTLPQQDQGIREELKAFSRRHPRWGWRKAHWYLRANGFCINHKKVQRLWREEGLRVPRKRKKKCRNGKQIKVHAERLNHVWAVDFQMDQTTDGKRLKFFNVIDEFSRESLMSFVARSITADDVATLLDGLVQERGCEPAFIRLDNGPEFTAKAIDAWTKATTTNTTFIDPGSPWQNGKVESYNGIFRDEVLNRELFDAVDEAQIVTDHWRHEYNTLRPHGSLRGMTPKAFAAACNNQQQPIRTF